MPLFSPVATIRPASPPIIIVVQFALAALLLAIVPAVTSAGSLACPPIKDRLRCEAQGGDPHAQTLLGYQAYSNGQLGKGYGDAAFWLSRAAAQGHPPAQSLLGVMYLVGEGVARDPEAARHWLELADRQDHTQAMTHLGFVYLRGHGVPPHRDAAIYWFKKAASAGNGGAICALRDLEIAFDPRRDNAPTVPPPSAR